MTVLTITIMDIPVDKSMEEPFNDNYDANDVAYTVFRALEQTRVIPHYGLSAARVVQICALLAPESIPDTVFEQDINEPNKQVLPFNGSQITFADISAAACRYGLLYRETALPGFRMHPQVQERIRNGFSEHVCKLVSGLAVQAVSAAFPEPDLGTWSLCERLLPHALLCARYITAYGFQMPEAARLLTRIEWYSNQCEGYGMAEARFQKALEAHKSMQGAGPVTVVNNLTDYAALRGEASRFAEVVSLLAENLERGLETAEEEFPDYERRLYNLAQVYRFQQRYGEAATLLERALDTTRRTQEVEHADVAARLGHLAFVYAEMQRYAEAEVLWLEALAILRKTSGEGDPACAGCLMNLATLYLQWGHLEEVETLLQQARTIGATVPDTRQFSEGGYHFWMGILRYKQGNRAASADHFCLALEIGERIMRRSDANLWLVREWLRVVTSSRIPGRLVMTLK